MSAKETGRGTSDWRNIPGYACPYRINDIGEVQQWRFGRWISLKPFLTNRLEIRLRGVDGKQKKVGVLRLMDELWNDGYGRKHGLCVCPKNGAKTDCTLENITYKKQSEIGKASMLKNMRKKVIQYDRNGNATVFHSVKEAARAVGLTPSALGHRLYHGTLDPRGYQWEVER